MDDSIVMGIVSLTLLRLYLSVLPNINAVLKSKSLRTLWLLSLNPVCMYKALKNRELKIKEALHIQLTPDNKKFIRDIGLELPKCWLSMLHANHPPGYNKQYA